jgi:polysaccharide pyruvyl transferase WcaK-like protein
MKTVVLGYYGAKNLGDELMLASLLHTLEGMSVCVFSFDSEYIQSQHKVSSIEISNPWNLIRCLLKIYEADWVILGGGTLVKDISMMKLLPFLLAARIFGKEIVGYSLEVYYLSSRILRLLTRKIFEGNVFFSVRNRESLRCLERMRIGTCNLLISSYPVLRVLERQNLERSEDQSTEENSCYLLISVRPTTMADRFDVVRFEELVADIADHAVERFGAVPVFWPMQPCDVLESKKVVMKMNNSEQAIVFTDSRITAEKRKILSRTRAAIGMRLHFLVLTLTEGIPSIGLVYSPKISRFMRVTSQPRIYGPENRDEILSLFSNLWNSSGLNEAQKISKRSLLQETDEFEEKFQQYTQTVLIGRHKLTANRSRTETKNKCTDGNSRTSL